MESIETEGHRDLRHVFAAAGRAHHAVFGGPNEGWARWYAEWMYGALLKLLTSDPSLEQIEQWLVDADAQYRSEEPDHTWPGFYADRFVAWDTQAHQA